MNFSSLLGGRLKDERKRLRYSQAEVAEKCGVSREIWGRYERGVSVPGAEVLKELAELGGDVQYVLTGRPCLIPNDASTQHLPADEQLMLEAYRGLKASARKDLLAKLLTGGKKAAGEAPQSDSGIKVSGSGHRVAGRDYREKE